MANFHHAQNHFSWKIKSKEIFHVIGNINGHKNWKESSSHCAEAREMMMFCIIPFGMSPRAENYASICILCNNMNK